MSALIEAIVAAQEAHPTWPHGKLIMHAYKIERGELNVNPGYATDDQLLVGLKALVPDDDEG